jgi:hypothetical protein
VLLRVVLIDLLNWTVGRPYFRTDAINDIAK